MTLKMTVYGRARMRKSHAQETFANYDDDLDSQKLKETAKP